MELVELGVHEKPARNVKADNTTDRYKSFIDEDAACSACYSSLVYALHRHGGKPRADGKIRIGQGFKGKSGEGIGVGNCTRGYAKNVPGCPPKATEIIKALKVATQASF